MQPAGHVTILGSIVLYLNQPPVVTLHAFLAFSQRASGNGGFMNSS